MKKSPPVLDLTKKVALIDRQQKLWEISDAIDLANFRNQPLPEEIALWLFKALRNIAFGEDANAVLDVVPEKQGVRKDGFKLKFEKQFAVSNIAAATSGITAIKTKKAIAEVSKCLPTIKQSTVRKSFNSSSAQRNSGFTPGKK